MQNANDTVILMGFFENNKKSKVGKIFLQQLLNLIMGQLILIYQRIL